MEGALRLNRRELSLIAVVSLANAMVWLNMSDIYIAIPTIHRELGTTPQENQLIGSVAFTLVVTAFLVAGGRIGDIIRERRAFQLGLAIFAAASLICAAIPDATALIAGRALQGVGASLLVTNSLAILGREIPQAKRGLAVGFFAAASAAAQGLGPAVGGVFVGAGMWQLAFWINIPLAAIFLYLSFKAVRKRVSSEPRSLDQPGVVTLALFAVTVTLVLIYGGTWGWGSPLSIAMWVVASASLIAFVVRETKASDPLLNLHLFKNPLFSASNGLLFAQNMVFALALFYLALYMQNVLGHTALVTGLLFLPMSLIAAFGGTFAGIVVDRIGPRLPMIMGGLLLAGGLFLAATIKVGDSYWSLLPALIVLGFGLLLSIIPPSVGVVQSVSRRDQSEASGVLNTVCMLGGTLGIAIGGSIFEAVHDSKLNSLIDKAGILLSPSQRDAMSGLLSGTRTSVSAAAHLAAAQAQELTQFAEQAFVSGMSTTFFVFGFVALAAAVAALLCARRKYFFTGTDEM